MTTTAPALVSVEDYLNTTYKPGCDYRAGVLTQKAMGTHKHGVVQSNLSYLIKSRFPAFLPASEQTIRINAEHYLVPDLVVQAKDDIQDPYPARPVVLCVEVLSPGDRMSATLSKIEEYHAWGQEVAWIIDPEERRAWEYRKGKHLLEIAADGQLTAGPITLPLADIFEDI